MSPILCLDLLAGAKYSNLAASYAQYGIRGFATTFGNFLPTAEKYLGNGGKHLGVNLLWHDNHKYGNEDIPEIRKLAKIYEALARKYPALKIELSTFCEFENVDNPDVYHDIAQDSAPSCTIVNTPGKSRVFSRKYKNEIHGSGKPPSQVFGGRYNYSIDGGFDHKPNNLEIVDVDAPNVWELHKNAEKIYLHHSRFNLRWSQKDKTPRPERTDPARKPSKVFISSIIYVWRERGLISIPKKILIKSHAEHHGRNPDTGQLDSKGDHLCIIYPQKVGKIELKKGGKLIDTLPCFGSYEGGGHRYYSKKFGFQNGRCDMYVNGKKIGTIDAGFRFPTRL